MTIRILGRKTSANVQKVLWCCEELAIPFERDDIGGRFGRNREPEYLALNPNGLVPTVLIDGFALWESNTIIRHLAASHGGGLLPADPRQRAVMEQWMDWELTVASPAMWTVYRQLVRTPPEQRDAKAIEAGRQVLGAAMTILDGRLDGNDYTAGARLTLSDIALGAVTYRWFNLAMERPPLPHLASWYERLRARPGYRLHVMSEMV